MAEIPDSEKLAIATHYLLSSPPGEIKEVLADVKVVLNNNTILTDGVLKGVFRKYNTQNTEVLEGPDGKPFILSEYGELDAKHYLTGTGEVVVVDHVTLKATKAGADAPKPSPGPFEGARAAIYNALKEYVDAQFNEGTATCSAFETKDGVVACICGVKTNLRNYWSGKWRSEWHFDPKGKTGSGKVRINIHYFEDGNVQMEQNKDIDKTGLSATDDKSFGEAAKAFVAKTENAIQDTLEEMYQNMSQETFKDMRRILPLTKTKMDWTGAQAKLATGMGKAKGS
jgi:capping protein alpha